VSIGGFSQSKRLSILLISWIAILGKWVDVVVEMATETTTKMTRRHSYVMNCAMTLLE
jgi:hypothetical protein